MENLVAVITITAAVFAVIGGLWAAGTRLRGWIRRRSQAPPTPDKGETEMTNTNDPPATQTGNINAEVVSINQTGGQTAKTIYNVGPQPRSLNPDHRATMVSYLSKYPYSVDVDSIYGDGEALHFADELRNLLQDAGWQIPDRISVGAFAGDPKGVTLWVNRWLASTEDFAEHFPELAALWRVLTNEGFDVSITTPPKEGDAGAQRPIKVVVGRSA